jgi:putative FmdB family regulatory protein
MPLFEFECGQCGRFEVIQKFSDSLLTTCPTCGGEVQKLPSSPAIQFKGTGWYVTDYARKSPGNGSKSEGSKSDSGKDSGKESGKESGSKGSSEGSGSSASGAKG